MKKIIEEQIMPKICETNGYKRFNTRDFLSKYLCDVFGSYKYDFFEKF